jgi:hypothetical protein
MAKAKNFSKKFKKLVSRRWRFDPIHINHIRMFRRRKKPAGGCDIMSVWRLVSPDGVFVFTKPARSTVND